MTSHTEPVPPSRTFASLRLPDAVFTPRGMAIAAALQAVGGLALAALGLRFDGAIDVQRTWRGEAVPWSTALVDLIAAWPVAATAAWGSLRVWRYRVSLSSLVMTLGAARLALVLMAPSLLTTPTPADITAMTRGQIAPPSLAIIAAGFAALVGVAGYVAFVVLRLRRLTGTDGRRLTLITTSVLVAAEVASKLVVALAH